MKQSWHQHWAAFFHPKLFVLNSMDKTLTKKLYQNWIPNSKNYLIKLRKFGKYQSFYMKEVITISTASPQPPSSSSGHPQSLTGAAGSPAVAPLCAWLPPPSLHAPALGRCPHNWLLRHTHPRHHSSHRLHRWHGMKAAWGESGQHWCSGRSLDKFIHW